ncbi:class I SAM-dependent methyltransferase [Rubellimicrobium aerolatum]|uniref:Class I SAM-dependent methyltransferase n=1 Tax=Rubellimicrobium aerolatum TaxID=490979 RepID=A0ABW0SEG7_9RHOB|nr:50S ribosomal protein L11 methyltransferase [Rubellimicrobium aerolatum]MBP1805634.1 putative nicotinamide N-methyase [Rubellimicrobium aerolatum]
MTPPPDPAQDARAEAFLRAHLPPAEVAGTGLRLHLAGPRSGLARLVPAGGTPYWAHAWPGGVALALHLGAHPGTVRGRPVLDLGAGSGIAALAALRAGASRATAVDSDPLAAMAARLNAEANGLPPPRALTLPPDRLAESTAAAPPGATILAGDIFYDAEAARQATAALDAAPPDATILVGDIGRRFLPLDRLEPLAAYPARDLGDPPSAPAREGWVFRWRR